MEKLQTPGTQSRSPGPSLRVKVLQSYICTKPPRDLRWISRHQCCDRRWGADARCCPPGTVSVSTRGQCHVKTERRSPCELLPGDSLVTAGSPAGLSPLWGQARRLLIPQSLYLLSFLTRGDTSHRGGNENWPSRSFPRGRWLRENLAPALAYVAVSIGAKVAFGGCEISTSSAINLDHNVMNLIL